MERRGRALPLLEFLLTELWARRERGLLTHGAYAAIGVKGAIATRAEAELERLTPEQREALRRVMIRLVTPAKARPTRALVRKSRQAMRQRRRWSDFSLMRGCLPPALTRRPVTRRWR